jgi:2-desacetyl-2-hydroxyethyl bacteriochlorophyllide A dehydrogenase
MKALVYTGVRKLEMQDWPDPQLGPGEALVRVGGVGVCGSDVHGWLGHSRGRVPPLVLGHEMAGVVERVEDGESAVRAGDHVAVYPLVGCGECSYCAVGRECLCRRKKLLGMHVAGGFAEYLKAPAKSLYPLPGRLSLAEGALVEPLSNALHFVRAAQADRGACAILGAGPIGLLILEVARVTSQTPDGRIAVVEVNPKRLAMARKHGASLVVNPKEPDALDRLDQFFGEDGCGVVFDAAGLSATRQMALRLVKSGGVIVLAGLSEPETAVDFIEVIRREVRLAGVYAYGREEFQLAVQWMAEGRVNLDGLLSEARLADGQAVFEDLARPDSGRMKVILKP